MTTDAVTTSDEAAADVPRGPAAATKDYVGKTARKLQRDYLQVESPRRLAAARAALARLRRGVGKSPSECPDLAEFYVNPALDARGDEPTRAEKAAHVALGLFALHQQSGRTPMHRPGVAFGRAARSIAGSGDSENAGVLRRFQALGTATDLSELANHARGLVQLLRREGAGFDYADFAADLVRFQNPNMADSVRLKWGRDFYRVWSDKKDREGAEAVVDEADDDPAA